MSLTYTISNEQINKHYGELITFVEYNKLIDFLGKNREKISYILFKFPQHYFYLKNNDNYIYYYLPYNDKNNNICDIPIFVDEIVILNNVQIKNIKNIPSSVKKFTIIMSNELINYYNENDDFDFEKIKLPFNCKINRCSYSYIYKNITN